MGVDRTSRTFALGTDTEDIPVQIGGPRKPARTSENGTRTLTLRKANVEGWRFGVA